MSKWILRHSVYGEIRNKIQTHKNNFPCSVFQLDDVQMIDNKQTVSHSSKNNQTITRLIFANGEQQYTVKNLTYFNFLNTKLN